MISNMLDVELSARSRWKLKGYCILETRQSSEFGIFLVCMPIVLIYRVYCKVQ